MYFYRSLFLLTLCDLTFMLYSTYIAYLRVSLVVIKSIVISFIKFKQNYLCNTEVPNGLHIHLDTSRIECCMLHQIYIFHTFSHNAFHRIQVHNLRKKIKS